MGIKFPPSPGAILLCDYSGFRAPEMVKRRPVVVISPRLSHRDGLCAVVPLSMTAPDNMCAYHCQLELTETGPPPWDSRKVWVKADMIATVCYGRLDFFHTERDQYGKRKYLHPKINAEQIRQVRLSLLHGLGLGTLTAHL